MTTQTMLAGYFRIQLRLIARRIRDGGMHPLLSLLIAAVFIYFLDHAFVDEKNKLLGFLLIFLPALVLIKYLAPWQRISFLKLVFPPGSFLFIRLMENMLVALPFFIILLRGGAYQLALLLVIFSLTLAVVHRRFRVSFTIPNPVFNTSFEFIGGYRKMLPLVLALYAVAIIGIYVDNFNLSFVAFLLSGLIPVSFFDQAEPALQIWNFSYSAKDFLFKKAKWVAVSGLLWNLPLFLLLAIFFWHRTPLLSLLVFVLCVAYVNAMFCKYACFPQTTNILMQIKLAVSLMFFPLMVISVPYFFSLARRQLKPVLD